MNGSLKTAVTLLKAVVELMEKQKRSYYVLNLLEEEVDLYDDVYDGYELLDEIKYQMPGFETACKDINIDDLQNLGKRIIDTVHELSAEAGVYKSLYMLEHDVRVWAGNRYRWIDVKEKLPEKGTWVLCFCRASIPIVLQWVGDGWYQDSRSTYMDSFVTHWMPLPSGPEEEET